MAIHYSFKIIFGCNHIYTITEDREDKKVLTYEVGPGTFSGCGWYNRLEDSC
jgi:hypothetical protein